jgi:hypothetical protein
VERVAIVVVTVVLACGGNGSPPPKQATSARAGSVVHRDLYCADHKEPIVRPAPRDGGYRRLPDEAAMQRLRAEIASVDTLPPATDRRVTRAVHMALDDLADELKRCLHGDTPAPDQRYVLRVYLSGNSVATTVTRVSLKRVNMKGGTAIESATTAESCFGGIFQMLELPPSAFIAQHVASFRADFCTTSIERDSAIASAYASAYPAFLVAHPGTCPAKIDELTPFAQPGAEPLDSYGEPFKLRCRGESLQVWSAGPDRKDQTDDDILSAR